MDKKFKQLIERYQEKRQMIELKQRHKSEELALEAKIQLKEAFLDEDGVTKFSDFDQFFKELHQTLSEKQEEFNETNHKVLEEEKDKLQDYFTKMLSNNDYELLGTNIVEAVMEQTMSELESPAFKKKLANSSDTEAMTPEEIAELTESHGIDQDGEPSEMVSTIDLEDLLKEIRTTIDE